MLYRYVEGTIISGTGGLRLLKVGVEGIRIISALCGDIT